MSFEHICSKYKKCGTDLFAKPLTQEGGKLPSRMVIKSFVCLIN